MKRWQNNKYVRAGLTLALGLAVFLFWRLRYPQALSYQEQFQLFLFDGDFLLERLAVPGGLARYVGEFLVQFYNNITIGAALIALLMMLAQRLTWRVAGGLYALSFLPPVLIWFAMGDESVLLTYTVAFVLSLLAVWPCPRQGVGRWVVLVVGIPLLYWAIGPMVLLTSLLLMPLSVIYAVACILASSWLVPYPLTQLWLSVGYYRFPETLPYMLVAVPLVVVALRYASPYLKRLRPALSVGSAVAVAALAVLLVPLGFDKRKYELIDYDYLVRQKDWNAIISKAEKQQPDLPMSVCSLNLALGMTNQLAERATDFYQHGSEGLLPPFERNFTTAQVTGEVYFHLGLVNTAQRFAFEAMESLPDHNKSGRCLKRLAETNLINGHYEVARKYLHLLQKTIFYRPWALRTEAMLGNEEAINNHPLYGWLRKVRLENDFLFSEEEIDKICGQLFMHNPQNAMATQYLVMAPLLDGDARRFVNYVKVVQERISHYNPRCVREGMARIKRTP